MTDKEKRCQEEKLKKLIADLRNRLRKGSFPLNHIFNMLPGNRAILKKIRALESATLSDKAPKEKTLSALWQIYGMAPPAIYYLAPDDYGLDLLKKWIEILYGRKTLDELDLDRRIEQIAEGYARAHRNNEGIRFVFGPPVETLINQLSTELPPYEEDGAG